MLSNVCLHQEHIEDPSSPAYKFTGHYNGYRALRSLAALKTGFLKLQINSNEITNRMSLIFYNQILPAQRQDSGGKDTNNLCDYKLNEKSAF